jgi:putative transposase
MQNYKLPPKNGMSTREPSLLGQTPAKSSTSFSLAGLSNMSSLPEHLLLKRLSVIYGLVATVKNKISSPKENFSYINILMLRLSLKLQVDSTLNEKSYGISWNKQLQEMSAQLWLHIKTDSPDLALSSSKNSWANSAVNSWYSTRLIPVQNKSSYKIFSRSSMSLVPDCTVYENTVTNSRNYRMCLNPQQKKLIRYWMKENKILYNQAIKELNQHQGFAHLGTAKGTKEQQFQTLWGRTKGWRDNVPIKLQHRTLWRAYQAWSECKADPKTRSKIAKEYTQKNFTISTDPQAWKKGKLYPKFWGNLPEIILLYDHKKVSLIGEQCLTISERYGRLYLSQPNTEKVLVKNTQRVIAIDPGLRSFATMFDGENGLSVTDEQDLTRLAKLSAYHAKLHKKAQNLTDWFARKKVYYKMSRLKRKMGNLVKELHRKLAAFLAKNYDIIYIPTYRVKRIYAKNKSNKTNRKNQLNWSWYKFVKELEYRCALQGSVAIIVSESYTSKTCSKCGHVHPNLGSAKIFSCPHCGHQLDRDLNGAINIFLNSLFLQGCLG